MMKRIKNFLMPLAMLIGAVAYPWLEPLVFTMPYLIFLMLVFTFNKLAPSDLRFNPLHWLLLLVQVGGAVGCYLLMKPLNPILAQGFLICLIAPTATAAAVITSLLSGNVAFVTTYTLLSNLMVALLCPLLFTWANGEGGVDFWSSMFIIFKKVFPLLFGPLVLSWVVRYTSSRAQAFIGKYSFLSFHIWLIALAVATAKLMKQVTLLDAAHYLDLVYLSGIALVCCAAQFLFGKYWGSKQGERIAAGQSLGQKNTILAIWLTQTFLNPMVALAPSMYIVWQNIVNSYQVAKARRTQSNKL